MMDLFDQENTAVCGRCGKAVPTLAGWPGPIAACVACDVWTNHKFYEEDPEIIDPATYGLSETRWSKLAHELRAEYLRERGLRHEEPSPRPRP